MEDFAKFLAALDTEIFFKDKEGRYIFTNRPHSDWIKPGVDIIGKFDREVQVDQKMAAACREEDIRTLQSGERTSYAYEANLNGQIRYYEAIKNPVRNASGEIIGLCGVVYDVTNHVVISRKLKDYYEKDKLTGLYNRNYFYNWLDNHTPALPAAVITLDCNYLKEINDNFGHQEGDKLLRLTAGAIKEAMPAQSLACRMGGDEFTVLCPACTEQELARLVQRLRDAFAARTLHGQALSVAMGCSCLSSEPAAVFAAIKRADAMMYEEKRRQHQKPAPSFGPA